MNNLLPYLMPILEKAAYAVGFLIVGVTISKIITYSIKRSILRNHGKDNVSAQKMANIVKRLVGATSIIIVVLISISILGINITIIIGGMGLAIGYAMEEMLGNIFASLMIITHKKYQVGDIVEVE
jgi:potassium-dependent mechanosensitive channel